MEKSKALDNPEACFVEVPKVVNGVTVSISLRDPTAEELAEATARRKQIGDLLKQIDTLRDQVKALTDSCPHVVCKDVLGFIYDNRFCFGCGLDKGEV